MRLQIIWGERGEEPGNVDRNALSVPRLVHIKDYCIWAVEQFERKREREKERE